MSLSVPSAWVVPVKYIQYQPSNRITEGSATKARGSGSRAMTGADQLMPSFDSAVRIRSGTPEASSPPHHHIR